MIQVTAGTLDAFSYVQWPEALLQLSNYAKFVQLNLVQVAPLHCFKDSFKMNAYVGLLITVALNVGVIVLAFAYFQIRKLLIKYEFHFSLPLLLLLLLLLLIVKVFAHLTIDHRL